MTVLREQLTNECLTHHLRPFELAERAIDRAREMIEKRRECRIPTDVQNQAYQVLLEILDEEENPQAAEVQEDTSSDD